MLFWFWLINVLLLHWWLMAIWCYRKWHSSHNSASQLKWAHHQRRTSLSFWTWNKSFILSWPFWIFSFFHENLVSFLFFHLPSSIIYFPPHSIFQLCHSPPLSPVFDVSLFFLLASFSFGIVCCCNFDGHFIHYILFVHSIYDLCLYAVYLSFDLPICCCLLTVAPLNNLKSPIYNNQWRTKKLHTEVKLKMFVRKMSIEQSKRTTNGQLFVCHWLDVDRGAR